MATIAEILADIDALLPTNGVGAITASILRVVLKEIVNNEQVTASQILASGSATSSTFLAGDNSWKPPAITAGDIQTSSGTPGSTTFLAGDNSWKIPPGVGGGSSANFSDTRATAMATSFPAVGSGGPTWLITQGYDTIGDTPVLNLYYRQNTDPTTVLRPWPASGKFQSVDGSWWVLQPQHREFWVEQFGAKNKAYFDLSYDNWQAFEDCKYAILMQGDNATPNGGGYTMRMGSGMFYLSKAHSIEGGGYNVQGAGFAEPGATYIRHPFNTDGFQIQFGYPGPAQTIGHEGAPLNPGFPNMIRGQLVFTVGTTRLYKVTSANGTTYDGAHPPTGTGTGIASGTATFDYVRELTWSETRGFATFRIKISSLIISGVWNTATDGYDDDQTAVDGAFHSGILMRGRALVEDILSIGHPGHGIAVIADGDLEIRSAGNVNGWVVRHVQCYYNGLDGLHIGSGDANAGSSYDVDTQLNGRWGIADWSFLGNSHYSPQSASDGAPGLSYNIRFRFACTYNGYTWLARTIELGAETPPANYQITPGTSGSQWILGNGSGTNTPSPGFEAFDPTYTHYTSGGSFSSNNINSATHWYGPYTEGGTFPPQWGAQDDVWGGETGAGVETSRNAYIHLQGTNFGRHVGHNAEYVFLGIGKRAMLTWLGQNAVNPGLEPPLNHIWGYRDWENFATYALQLKGATTTQMDHMDVVFKNDAVVEEIFGWTGISTNWAANRSSGQVRDTFWMPRFILGSQGVLGSDTNARTWQMTSGGLGTGTTPAGTSKEGEMFVNANPSAGAGDPWAWQVRGGLFWPLYP